MGELENKEKIVVVNKILNNKESRLQPVLAPDYRLKPRLQLFNIILTPTVSILNEYKC